MKKVKAGSLLVVAVILLIGTWMLLPKAQAWNECYGDNCAPHATPTPKPVDCNEDHDNSGKEECPKPTLTPVPTSTPSSIPGTGGTGVSDGGASNSDATKAQVSICTVNFPVPVLTSMTVGKGIATLYWTADSTVDKFSIIYGYSEDKLVFGVNDISGNSRSFTINALVSGNHVWAQVWAWYGGCAEESNILDPIVL